MDINAIIQFNKMNENTLVHTSSGSTMYQGHIKIEFMGKYFYSFSQLSLNAR